MLQSQLVSCNFNNVKTNTLPADDMLCNLEHHDCGECRRRQPYAWFKEPQVHANMWIYADFMFQLWFFLYEYILCLNHIFMCDFPPSARNVVTFNYMWDISIVSHIQEYTWTESKLNQPAERIRFIDLHIHMVYARAKQGTDASMNPPL